MPIDSDRAAIAFLLVHIRDCWVAIHNASEKESPDRALSKERGKEAESMITALGFDPTNAPPDIKAERV